MAGDSKQHQLSVRVYNSLQSLGCPLVEGLYLKEAESMQQLFCTPSPHRMDILKWICVRICPSLRDKFLTIKSTQTDDMVKEITRFGHEMLLCKADDQELIKGVATPLKQLLLLDGLLAIVQDNEKSSETECLRNKNLLTELMSPKYLADLTQVMNPVCNPWSTHIQEHLRTTHTALSKANCIKSSDCKNRSLNQATFDKVSDDLIEATSLLQSTRITLEKLQKECEFLQSDQSIPASTLSPCALKVALSDMAQSMNAFSQVYNTDFKSYCQRTPPVLNQSTCVFRSVHQLLQRSNMELEALQQLSETSSSLTETVEQMQTDEVLGHR